jgi:hypothetical protein
MVRAWHGRGMASVNQIQPHYVNKMGKTHSKPLPAQHGREKAWARPLSRVNAGLLGLGTEEHGTVGSCAVVKI